MDIDVRHDEDRSTYALLVDGREAGECHYRVAGDTAVFDHTHVDPAFRGRGLADRLVKAALDDVRDRRMKVRGQCWFVAEVLDREPSYADLVAS